MAFSTGARHGMSYIAESTFGETPATPSMTAVRHTATTLNLTKQSLQSQEIRSDRQIADFRHGNKQVGGDLSTELSYGAFDGFLEAVLGGTWTEAGDAGPAGDVLKAGVLFRSFTFERAFTDIGQHLIYRGCALNTWALSVAPNQIVTSNFGVLGKSMSTSGTPLDADITPAAANAPYDSFTGVLNEGGTEIAIVTSLELSLDNGLEPTFVVGSDVTPQIVAGRSNITGTLSAYFENLVLLNKFINETETSLELTLGAGATALTLKLPRIKYSGGDLPVQGEGAVVMNMPFQALFDATDASNIVITR